MGHEMVDEPLKRPRHRLRRMSRSLGWRAIGLMPDEGLPWCGQLEVEPQEKKHCLRKQLKRTDGSLKILWKRRNPGQVRSSDPY